MKEVIEAIVREKKAILDFNLTKKVAIIFQCNETVPLMVTLDQEDLKRVLSNLIDNSFDAIEHSGEITIELRRKQRFGIIEIKDNGCGIPSELLDNVMTVGFSMGKADGHGLGLSGAKAFVEAMGGEISIESSLNVGTMVTLKLNLV